jgi:hypothetical protein
VHIQTHMHRGAHSTLSGMSEHLLHQTRVGFQGLTDNPATIINTQFISVNHQLFSLMANQLWAFCAFMYNHREIHYGKNFSFWTTNWKSSCYSPDFTSQSQRWCKCIVNTTKSWVPYSFVTQLIQTGKVKCKAVPLHAMEALGGKGGKAPTHSRPRH